MKQQPGMRPPRPLSPDEEKHRAGPFTRETLPRTSPEEIERMLAIRDEDIDYSDDPPWTEAQWAEASERHREALRQRNGTPRQVNVPVDEDLVEFFRANTNGEDYRDRINEALRVYIAEHPQ